MKVRFTLSIGFGKGASREETIEYPDDATDEYIEEDYIEWRNNYLDGGWRKVDEEA